MDLARKRKYIVPSNFQITWIKSQQLHVRFSHPNNSFNQAQRTILTIDHMTQ